MLNIKKKKCDTKNDFKFRRDGKCIDPVIFSLSVGGSGQISRLHWLSRPFVNRIKFRAYSATLFYFYLFFLSTSHEKKKK